MKSKRADKYLSAFGSFSYFRFGFVGYLSPIGIRPEAIEVVIGASGFGKDMGHNVTVIYKRPAPFA